MRTVGPCTLFCHCALVCQCLPQITWIAAVEFYVGVLGRLLAGFGRPMPSEGPVKKRRRFGTSCPRVSWSGSRPRPPGVSRGLMKTPFFPSRRKRNRGIWTRGAGGQYSVSHGSSFHWLQGLPRPRTQPKGKLAKKALSWPCTMATQATHCCLHCENACPGQAWCVCVQIVPCSTVSKRRKSRARIAVAVLGW